METGLGRPLESSPARAKLEPGLVFFLQFGKNFYRGNQGKIVNFGPSDGPGPGWAWDFGPTSTLTDATLTFDSEDQIMNQPAILPRKFTGKICFR